MIGKAMVVGFTGKARSGKDTAAAILAGQTGGLVLSMAGTMKRMLLPLLEALAPPGIERFKHVHGQIAGELKEQPIAAIGKSPRELLQTLGTEWGRHLIREDLWIIVQRHLIGRASSVHNVVIIPDVRYDNEAELCDRIYQISRDDVPEVAEHTSEAGLNPELITAIISNNGTVDDLRKKISSVAQSVEAELGKKGDN